MSLTEQQLADLMPDATQLESNEPEMDSALHCGEQQRLSGGQSDWQSSCARWGWSRRVEVDEPDNCSLTATKLSGSV